MTHAVQVSPPQPRAGRGATAGPENKDDMFGFMFEKDQCGVSVENG